MLAFILLECLIVATSADHVDSGQYFKKISGENDVIADNAAFLNEDFFKCHRSQSCVVNRRGVRNKEKWEKVPNNEPVCKYFIQCSRSFISCNATHDSYIGRKMERNPSVSTCIYDSITTLISSIMIYYATAALHIPFLCIYLRPCSHCSVFEWKRSETYLSRSFVHTDTLQILSF